MNFWDLSILHWILGLIVFLFSSGILILVALYFDHRRNINLFFNYVVGFIVFGLIGISLVTYFRYYTVFAAPIIIWGYFFYMFWTKKESNSEEID